MIGIENFDYYVYLLLDAKSQTVFYVGKGRGERYKDHLIEYRRYQKMIDDEIPTCNGNFSNHGKLAKISSILNSGSTVNVLKVCENLSEENAYKLEINLINYFGRIINRTGLLENIEAGGTGSNYHFFDTKFRNLTESEITKILGNQLHKYKSVLDMKQEYNFFYGENLYNED